MNSKSIKLTNRFNANATKPGHKDGKKGATIEGPLKMLDWLTNQIKDYSKFTPLIRVFSNPGMK